MNTDADSADADRTNAAANTRYPRMIPPLDTALMGKVTRGTDKAGVPRSQARSTVRGMADDAQSCRPPLTPATRCCRARAVAVRLPGPVGDPDTDPGRDDQAGGLDRDLVVHSRRRQRGGVSGDRRRVGVAADGHGAVVALDGVRLTLPVNTDPLTRGG